MTAATSHLTATQPQRPAMEAVRAFSPIPDAPRGAGDAERYLRGMQRLVRVVQELSLVRDMDGLQKIVRTAARELTGADGATFVLREGDQCFYADEDAIEPLWKGLRFPMEICVSGWVMLNRQAVVIEDIYADPRVPHDAYRPTFVKSLATVPIRTSAPIGAIGNFWARRHQPQSHDLALLQALADTTAVALENLAVHAELEQRVRDRTAELEARNAEVRRLSLTDELTQLWNRRGLLVLVEQELKVLRRSGARAALVYLDLDGLKAVNDQLGHEVGDQMICEFARVLEAVFRDGDVVARLGGDEFCVVTPGGGDDPAGLSARVLAALAARNAHGDLPFPLSASVGCVTIGEDGCYELEPLLSRADQRMYAEKRRRRDARDPAA